MWLTFVYELPKLLLIETVMTFFEPKLLLQDNIRVYSTRKSLRDHGFVLSDCPVTGRWRIISGLVICLVLAVQVGGTSAEPDSFPSLISSLEGIETLEFCGERVPLEIEEVRERLEKELLLSVWDRAQVILWLKRSHRYLPYIRDMLRENKMPDDLKYLPVVESALLSHIRSTEGAVGFWQFLAGTGRRYGLVINKHIDERRNLFASTRAALRYLRDLHTTFDSWTLAVAAYNMGEHGLAGEIFEQQSTDYYNLYLPLETQRFVFRILAVKLIFSAPEKFGFEFSEEEYYSPIRSDQVRIDCSQKVPIRIVAQAAKTHFKVIKDLNQEIRGHYLRPGSHDILIPEGAAEGFHERFRGLLDDFLAGIQGRIYVVEKGDSLSSIAEKFDIPISALLICNDLNPRRPIYPGNKIIICMEEKTKPGIPDIGEESVVQQLEWP